MPKDVSVVIFSAVRSRRPGKPGLLGWLGRGGLLRDTIDRSDGISVLDGIGVGALIGSLGGVIGYLCDRLIPEKRRDQPETAAILSLIMVQVTCLTRARSRSVRRLLKANNAKQMAVLADPAGPERE